MSLAQLVEHGKKLSGQRSNLSGHDSEEASRKISVGLDNTNWKSNGGVRGLVRKRKERGKNSLKERAYTEEGEAELQGERI